MKCVCLKANKTIEAGLVKQFVRPLIACFGKRNNYQLKIIKGGMTDSKQKLRGGQFAVWLSSEYQSINFALTARLQGAVTPEQIRVALDKVQFRYPPLSMRLAQESNRCVYLVPDARLKIPIRIVGRQHSEQWLGEVTTELGLAFDLVNDPPLRLVWLRGQRTSEMIFVCPHVLADGLSVVYLIRDFLKFLDDPEADVKPMPLTSPMSELLPDFPGKRMIIRQSKLKAAILRFLLILSPRQEIKGSTKTDYHLLAWELTGKQTSALVARSRSEKTTVHAALCTVFLRAFGEFQGDGWKRKAQSPISLRHRLTNPVGEAFGLFVNLMEFGVNCSPQRDFWEVAREVKEAITRRADDRYAFRSLTEANVMMDKLGSVVPAEFVARSVMTVSYDLSVTNLGRLDIPTQYGKLHLDGLYGPSLGGDPDNIVLGVITIGDRMHFTLSFTDIKLSVSEAEKIKEKAMSSLEDAVNSSQ